MFIVTETVNAFVLLRISCGIFKLVASCAEGVGFFSSAVGSSVVESEAFTAPGCHHVVLYFADLPSEVYLLVQKQLSNLSTQFHYQIPCVFPVYVAKFSVYVSMFQVENSILCSQGAL